MLKTESQGVFSGVYDAFKGNLPEYPYATDDLTFGLKIQRLENAIKRRYIQYNKPTDCRWLVYDVDRADGAEAWAAWHDEKRLVAPPPNFAVENPENGHAHLFYGLDVPVYMQTGARANPIRFVSAVDVALTTALNADGGFAKLISKNPLNDHWAIFNYNPELYDLHRLAEALPNFKEYADRRKKLPAVGLGRNCTLFDTVRFWAYRRIRTLPNENLLFPELYGEAAFIDSCIRRAEIENRTFASPLPYSECKTIGKSVGKWVYRNMSPAGFLAWCRRRAVVANKKSIIVRHSKSLERAAEAQKLRQDGLKQTEIAEKLGLNQSQVSRLLKISLD